ncbi:MAG: hypothetical protein KC433_10445 [Anaerolineales bacterium]|nr:hypothetical protein [Anaerolineales bacterium]
MCGRHTPKAETILDIIEHLKAPEPQISGVVANEPIDEEEVWERAIRQNRRLKQKEQRKKEQVIAFERGPVCIVNFADLHCGNEGVDYERIDRELDIVLSTPGMYAGFIGDLLDNFIIGKLARLEMHSSFKITEEWAMVKRITKKAAPKMLWSVSGNHDYWTVMTSGIDYFREVHASLPQRVLYDDTEINVDMVVGAHTYKWRLRHKWKGSSIYNDTHAVERAAKFDKGKHFDIGVMAHTHTSGLARQFNNGGKTGLAIICGAYKRYDKFANQVGFPQANEQCAVAIVLDDQGGMTTFSNLETAAAYMRVIYGH